MYSTMTSVTSPVASGPWTSSNILKNMTQLYKATLSIQNQISLSMD